MTDGQLWTILGALFAVVGTLAGAIKWSVGRITKSIDRNTDASAQQAERFVALETKIDFVYRASGEVRDFVTEERSGVHEVASESTSPVRRNTPVGGYSHGRPKTQGER